MEDKNKAINLNPKKFLCYRDDMDGSQNRNGWIIDSKTRCRVGTWMLRFTRMDVWPYMYEYEYIIGENVPRTTELWMTGEPLLIHIENAINYDMEKLVKEKEMTVYNKIYEAYNRNDEVALKTRPATIKERAKHFAKKVIFNDPATIVFWYDGTKTVVKKQEGDEFDPEVGLLMAYFKHAFGNKSNCNELIRQIIANAEVTNG